MQINHPVLKAKISLLRNINTGAKDFRLLTHQISTILAVHATNSLAIHTEAKGESPIATFLPNILSDNIGIFPILRSGIGMTDAFLDLVPDAHVHHLGLYREKTTYSPVEYYNKLPQQCGYSVGFVLDPMIATAGTAIAAVNILKDWGLKRIIFCCILSSEEGLNALINTHPDIQGKLSYANIPKHTVFVGEVDSLMNEHKYIVPGAGDVGDRLFNTFK